MAIVPLTYVAVLRSMWGLMFLILHPFLVHFGSFFVDSVDHKVIRRLGYSREFYERFDYVFDNIYIVYALVYIAAVHIQKPHWQVIFFCGLWRLLGGIFFLATLWHWFPLIFANVFSLLFLLYTLLDVVGIRHYLDKPRRFQLFVMIVVFLKYAMEYQHHILGYSSDMTPPCDSVLEWFLETYGVYLSLFGLIVLFGLLRGPLLKKSERLNTVAMMLMPFEQRLS